MAKPRPLDIKPRKESSFGKWFLILLLLGAAGGAYVKRDLVMDKLHEFVHGPKPVDEVVAPAAPAAPVAAVPAPTPVSTPDNPCGAFANDPNQLALCKDQQAKIQRMKDAAAARDKVFLPPAPPAPPGTATNTQQPATNTTGH